MSNAKLSSIDRQQVNPLVREYSHLVLPIAQAYAGRWIPVVELLRVGMASLSRAAETFDPSAGGRFTAWASWWIKDGMRGVVASGRRTARLAQYR